MNNATSTSMRFESMQKHMQAVKKMICLGGLLLLICRSAFSFALLGPFDDYQVTSLDYQFAGDIGGPMNLGEEYRWTLPVLYYSFDQSFLDYFGSNGVVAVEAAFNILNNLTNFTSYSSELNEFPLDSTRVNFRAQALQLIDVKSVVLHLLVEEMGLAEPDRYTWTLRNRVLPPGASCPAYIYNVIQRNFDPVTFEPSRFVNDALYSYNIFEYCPTPDRADAVEFLVDPDGIPFSAVASLGSISSFTDLVETDEGVSRYGFFYTGLTRDDVGGLRYIYRTNNMNVEAVETNSLQFVTNLNPVLLVGSNLNLLAAQALTNNATDLAALFPGLVITSSTNFFTNVFVTNITAFFTSFPWDPNDAPLRVAYFTNVTSSVQTLFRHTFANVITVQSSTNGQLVPVPLTDLFSFTNRAIVANQTITVLFTNFPWLPVDSVIVATNFSSNLRSVSGVSGEFFILPTNACDVAILANQLTNIVLTTNIISTITNVDASTNITSGQILSVVQQQLQFYTNHTLVVLPISCVPGTVTLRQGIDHIQFIRRDFDSLLGQFFQPFTNTYTLNAVTNNQIVKQRFTRVVTQPDILFSAADLVAPPTTFPPGVNFAARTTFDVPHINNANALPDLPGPGTIEPRLDITLNKIGPIRFNVGPQFLDEATSQFIFQWGSYDGSTNEPIVYPSGTSIRNLEDQVLISVTTTSFTNGIAGQTFNEQLQGTGGTTPYTFTLSQTSPALPAGLMLAPDGTITGTPQNPGNYSVIVRLTDAGARFIEVPVTLTISNSP